LQVRNAIFGPVIARICGRELFVFKSINSVAHLSQCSDECWKALKPRCGLCSAMKAGRVVRRFCARDKCRVVLRTPRWEDLDDLLEMINSLVEEKADIVRGEKVLRVDEIDWLARSLGSLEKDEVFYLVAEVDGKVVANSEIGTRRGGYDRHVGVVGIARLGKVLEMWELGRR